MGFSKLGGRNSIQK
jgi:hypothetical protein